MQSGHGGAAVQDMVDTVSAEVFSSCKDGCCPLISSLGCLHWHKGLGTRLYRRRHSSKVRGYLKFLSNRIGAKDFEIYTRSTLNTREID